MIIDISDEVIIKGQALVELGTLLQVKGDLEYTFVLVQFIKCMGRKELNLYYFAKGITSITSITRSKLISI